MSKMTLQGVSEDLRRLGYHGYADAIAAHLAAQAEWPSEDDVDRVAKMIADAVGNGMREKYESIARASLQSVCPPVGVVFEEDVRIAREAYRSAFDAENMAPIEQIKLAAIRRALESYASRHAPTKD